jgi:hypothetical protein
MRASPAGGRAARNPLPTIYRPGVLLHLAESVSGTAREKAALPYRQLNSLARLAQRHSPEQLWGLTEDSEKGAAHGKNLRASRGTNRHPIDKADSCRFRAVFGPEFSFSDVGWEGGSKLLAIPSP